MFPILVSIGWKSLLQWRFDTSFSAAWGDGRRQKINFTVYDKIKTTNWTKGRRGKRKVLVVGGEKLVALLVIRMTWELPSVNYPLTNERGSAALMNLEVINTSYQQLTLITKCLHTFSKTGCPQNFVEACQHWTKARLTTWVSFLQDIARLLHL